MYGSVTYEPNQRLLTASFSSMSRNYSVVVLDERPGFQPRRLNESGLDELCFPDVLLVHRVELYNTSYLLFMRSFRMV